MNYETQLKLFKIHNKTKRQLSNVERKNKKTLNCVYECKQPIYSGLMIEPNLHLNHGLTFAWIYA